jgi:hypothetical protein
VPYVRTVKTASGATAVQIVYSSRRGSRDIEHLGSAHDEVELELLKAAARQRLAAGQGVLDLGVESGGKGGGPLPITASRMDCLLGTLEHPRSAPPGHRYRNGAQPDAVGWTPAPGMPAAGPAPGLPSAMITIPARH